LEAHPVLDRDALRDLQKIIGGSRSDLKELFVDFLEDTLIQLELMTKAALASDSDTVRRIAHTLKSNSRDLGAVGFAQLCAKLEGDLNTTVLVVDLSARVMEITALWPDVRSALEAEIMESGSPS
jgi:HPt (histidine-containing phosphotransfer) domain-containing protein